jgi:peptidoglycan hydrolase-like protein with peptidoglycan-binding domain
MKPTRIVIHNTANDASANDEVAYMHRNKNKVSFHFAVDDVEAIQALPLDRNSWNAGDGSSGIGNREGISIEICYSKSGGDRWLKAVENAARLTASLLHKYGWGIDKVTKHQDYSGKHCPHRILDEYGWDNFINLVKKIIAKSQINQTVHEWQCAAIADGFRFPKYGADGKWGSECENVAKQAVCKKRLTYKYRNLTKIVQRAVGVTVDGKFGNDTHNAVINFQKLTGLVPDGCVGLNTWKKILGVK